MNYPIWVSSMTGGTEEAKTINQRLAQICGEFGLGMGLGSCRQLLYSDERLSEFSIRKYMPDAPLFANLGIAQIEELLAKNQSNLINLLIYKLEADGLIIHINPLQEWLQPEGDIIKDAPIDTIKKLISTIDIPIIVKEVGQGMGINSLKALLNLPIEAVDFAANGGTNFSKLELFRATEVEKNVLKNVAFLGHDCNTMVNWTNSIKQESQNLLCKKLIISGGIKDFLDGYYLTEKSKIPAVYGMASGFLKQARIGMEELRHFTKLQIEGLKMAKSLLSVKQ